MAPFSRARHQYLYVLSHSGHLVKIAQLDRPAQNHPQQTANSLSHGKIEVTFHRAAAARCSSDAPACVALGVQERRCRPPPFWSFFRPPDLFEPEAIETLGKAYDMQLMALYETSRMSCVKSSPGALSRLHGKANATTLRPSYCPPLPIPSAATKVSAAAAKQQHQHNNNQDQFHGISFDG
jgi:hypothetical protein